MSALLRLEGVEAGYGDLVAVRDVSLEVRPGEVVALIGSNGAGKTTTLPAVPGLLPVRRGRVEFEGERLDGLGPAQVVARGIAHVPEARQLFPSMTVRENLELGAGRRARRARSSCRTGATSSRTAVSCSTARAPSSCSRPTSSAPTSGDENMGGLAGPPCTIPSVAMRPPWGERQSPLYHSECRDAAPLGRAPKPPCAYAAPGLDCASPR